MAQALQSWAELSPCLLVRLACSAAMTQRGCLWLQQGHQLSYQPPSLLLLLLPQLLLPRLVWGPREGRS